jgi:hypothetical protein
METFPKQQKDIEAANKEIAYLKEFVSNMDEYNKVLIK